MAIEEGCLALSNAVRSIELRRRVRNEAERLNHRAIVVTGNEWIERAKQRNLAYNAPKLHGWRQKRCRCLVVENRNRSLFRSIVSSYARMLKLKHVSRRVRYSHCSGVSGCNTFSVFVAGWRPGAASGSQRHDEMYVALAACFGSRCSVRRSRVLTRSLLLLPQPCGRQSCRANACAGLLPMSPSKCHRSRIRSPKAMLRKSRSVSWLQFSLSVLSLCSACFLRTRQQRGRRRDCVLGRDRKGLVTAASRAYSTPLMSNRLLPKSGVQKRASSLVCS
jgi:hypothetical protein